MSTQMTYIEYMSYSAEINTLKRLLDGLPVERASERYGFEYRLERAQKMIEGVPVPPLPKRLSVSFSGEPVQSNYGLDANFGAEAVSMVSDAVRLTTAGMTGELKATGQIPRNTLGQPIITGVTFGSFGFVMELPAPSGDPYGTSRSEEAVNQIQELLRLASNGTDDDLSTIASSIHPRAVNKVAELLEFMTRRHAKFSLDYQGNTVRYLTEADVENASDRLNPSNVEGRTTEIIGTMIGIIPATRHFELRQNGEPPIHGRIGSEIRNPYRTAEHFTNRRVRALVRTARIGRGAPRHTLLAVHELPDSAAD